MCLSVQHHARLAVLSPVFGCGKTKLLTLIKQLVLNPTQRYNNLRVALSFRPIDSKGPKMLFIHEANNENFYRMALYALF